MRKFILALWLVTAWPTAFAEMRTWDFRVLLDGHDIGRHRFTLRETNESRELRSEAQFDIRVLLVSVYRYMHEAVERWNGNCLESLVSRTDTNGRRQNVEATAEGNRLAVVRGEKREQHEGCIMSFAYWNPQILKAKQLLNSQTGELLPVTVTPKGEAPIVVRGERLTAERYRIVGKRLEIDLWYDEGRWLGLEALTDGGRRLRYELR
jgi:hypothetical protein